MQAACSVSTVEVSMPSQIHTCVSQQNPTMQNMQERHSKPNPGPDVVHHSSEAHSGLDVGTAVNPACCLKLHSLLTIPYLASSLTLDKMS